MHLHRQNILKTETYGWKWRQNPINYTLCNLIGTNSWLRPRVETSAVIIDKDPNIVTPKIYLCHCRKSKEIQNSKNGEKRTHIHNGFTELSSLARQSFVGRDLSSSDLATNQFSGICCQPHGNSQESWRINIFLSESPLSWQVPILRRRISFFASAHHLALCTLLRDHWVDKCMAFAMFC